VSADTRHAGKATAAATNGGRLETPADGNGEGRDDDKNRGGKESDDYEGDNGNFPKSQERRKTMVLLQRQGYTLIH
jgi:hypothetical protein